MKTAAPACERYLAEAAAAGLVEQARGHRYVVGVHEDPLSDERRLLVEYCDEELLTDLAWLTRLVEQARALEPAVAAVVVRAPGTVRLDDPWQRTISYVIHPADSADAASGAPAVPGVTVSPAETAQDEDRITEWLARAMVDGSADHGHTADPATAVPLARECLSDPDRFSYLARLGGTAVGHATLLCAAQDEVTGRRAVELVDILVELADRPRRGAVAAALTSAALAHAHRLDLPLLGHVVHPSAQSAADHGDRIVAALLTQGWNLDHVFWRRSLHPSR